MLLKLNESFHVNEPEGTDRGYTIESGYQILFESEQEWGQIASAMMSLEAKSLMENNTLLLERGVSAFIDKAKGWFAKLWDKIKAFGKRVLEWFQAWDLDDQRFLGRFPKAKIEEMAKNLRKDFSVKTVDFGTSDGSVLRSLEGIQKRCTRASKALENAASLDKSATETTKTQSEDDLKAAKDAASNFTKNTQMRNRETIIGWVGTLVDLTEQRKNVLREAKQSLANMETAMGRVIANLEKQAKDLDGDAKSDASSAISNMRSASSNSFAIINVYINTYRTAAAQARSILRRIVQGRRQPGSGSDSGTTADEGGTQESLNILDDFM